MKAAVLGPITKDFIDIDGKLSTQIGGIPYYVASALRSLDTQEVAVYVTCGFDDVDWVGNNFPDIKVNILPNNRTFESHIKYFSDYPDEREVNFKPNSNVFSPDDKTLKEIKNYDYIFLGPLTNDNIPLAVIEKLKGCNLVLGNYGVFASSEEGELKMKNPENLINILHFIKFLFIDKKEAEFLSGKEGVKESSEYLLKRGLNNLVITEGSKGSHVFVQNIYYKIPAYKPKNIIDATGAGDTYEAAFIRAQELFDNPKEQGEFAAMVACMSLEKKGAFNGSLNDVLHRLKKKLCNKNYENN